MSTSLGHTEDGHAPARGDGAACTGAPVSVMERRRALMRLGGLAVVFGVAAVATRAGFAGTQAGRIIEVEARRFKFTPSEITLKRGEEVTLAFRSIDFIHGFNVPDLHLRADLVPGRITEVKLQPMRAGRFAFLCDNFCGAGHEEMNGMLIVEG